MGKNFFVGRVALKGMDETIAALQKKGVDVRAGIEAICMAGAEVVRVEIAGRAGERLAGSIITEIHGKTPNKVTVFVGPTKKDSYLAGWREFGTKPHVIPRTRKRGRKVLHLPDGSFRRSVPHPGTRAHPFIRPGYEASIESAVKAMGEKTKQVVRG